MGQQRVRLIGYAWGRSHVDELLSFALSSALAPGNLPALAKVFDCSVVIVTESTLFDVVREHPSIRYLESICPLKLIALDDLLSEKWQYGVTIAYALYRGFEDLGGSMTETYLLFINSDFVLADGSYLRMIGRIQSGECAHVAPSYCTVAEDVTSALAEKCASGVLSAQPRELASLILRHSHNTVRSKTINQAEIEFEHMDQFYWKVDAHTLIGRQMPIALVGMRPERHVTSINTMWDWGIVYECCPSKRITPLGDSDEFLIMELRPASRSLESLRLGKTRPRSIASRMKDYITQYQIDNAQFSLVLHSRDLPEGLADAQSKLQAYVNNVLAYLPTKPLDHRNHKQWIYHKKHFRFRLERRANRLGLGRPVPRKGTRPTPRSIEAAQPRPLTLLRRIFRINHPYRLPDHPIQQLIRHADGYEPQYVLAVCHIQSHVLEEMWKIGGNHTCLTPKSVLFGALNLLPKGIPKFDACIIELDDANPRSAIQVVSNALSWLREDCRLILFWNASNDVPLPSARNKLAELIVTSSWRCSLHYTNSMINVLLGHQLDYARRGSRILSLAVVGAAFVMLPLAVMARVLALRSFSRLAKREPKWCDSIAVEFDLGAVDPADQVDLAHQRELLLRRMLPLVPRRRQSIDLFYNERPAFTKWVVKSGFLHEPFIVVDVGVLGGENPRWDHLGDHLVVHGFDAVKEAIEELRAKDFDKRKNYHWLGIGNEDREREFFVDASEPTKSSFTASTSGSNSQIVRMYRLDSLYKQGIIPRADFLKIDVEGFENNVLVGATDLLSSGVLGVEIETNFHTSVDYPKSHFSTINDRLLEYGLRVFDLNFDRTVRSSYQEERARRRLARVAESEEGSGMVSTFNVLFCRDLPAERTDLSAYERMPATPSVEQILKMMIIYELHGLSDVAVDTAAEYSGELEKRIDVEEAVSLLCGCCASKA